MGGQSFCVYVCGRHGNCFFFADSTAEYIAGDGPDGLDGAPTDPESMVKSGLHCVTVLIGAYDRSSGIPLMGVINQPFYMKDKNEYGL